MIRVCLFLLLLGLITACNGRLIQQGNVIKDDKLDQIQVGDSRFRVETLMGSPAITDSLHPGHVVYIEQYDNPETDESYIHRVDIVYDKALRVESIERTGMKEKEQQNHG